MNKPSVLVIDDDRTLLSLVEATLENADFTPITTQSAKEGLKIISSTLPKAIVLDIEMPEISGKDLLKRLKENEKTKKIPILMLTGHNTIDDVSVCLELGASDYIVKPFDPQNLILRVGNIIKRGYC